MIIEIGFDVPEDSIEHFMLKIKQLGLPHYIEPPNRFNSLEDLECQCEGK